MRGVGTIALLVCLISASSLRAQANPACPPTGGAEIVMSPGNGAMDVATNALIRVRVRDDERPVLQLTRVADMTAVPARWQRIEETEHFVVVPDALLEPNTRYRLEVRSRSGASGETLFTTMDDIDREPPEFEFGPDAVIDYSSSPIPASCGVEEGSYRVTINVPAAQDDGAKGSVELLLYLTRASGLEAPVLLQRVYNQMNQNPIAFVLTPEQLATPVCVVVDAVDGVGNHATDIEEFCFDPLQGNFFEACSVTRAPTFQHTSVAVSIAAAWLALSVRFRRLRRRSRR